MVTQRRELETPDEFASLVVDQPFRSNEIAFELRRVLRTAILHPDLAARGIARHLAAISAKIAAGGHATLLVDQAGWHLSHKLAMPDNITPANCPELNPRENVWEFMRDNWLSNRVFTCYDNLVDHCCDAWNKLVEQRWRIMSLGLRDRANQY